MCGFPLNALAFYTLWGVPCPSSKISRNQLQPFLLILVNGHFLCFTQPPNFLGFGVVYESTDLPTAQRAKIKHVIVLMGVLKSLYALG